jgi:hypothetical protein
MNQDTDHQKETNSNRLEAVAAPLACLSAASQLANASIPCGRAGAGDAACTFSVMQHQDLIALPTCQTLDTFSVYMSAVLCA